MQLIIETHEVTVSDGAMNIAFPPRKDNAKISAIKIANKVFGNKFIGV